VAPLLTVWRWHAITGAQTGRRGILTSGKRHATTEAHHEKEEISMANLDRENMAEDVKKRFDALSEYERQAVEAIMEATDYSIEEALDYVERGDFEFYSEIFSLADLAHTLVEEGYFGDPKAMGVLLDYVDYDWFGSDLRHDGYTETSLGVVRVF